MVQTCYTIGAGRVFPSQTKEFEMENDFEIEPTPMVAVLLEPALAEEFLGTTDREKFYKETGWDPEPEHITRVNVQYVGAFITDASSCVVDNGGPLQVGAMVHVTETPCPLDGCNHWIQNIPGRVVFIGNDTDYWPLQNAEPTVNYYFWLQ